MGQLDGKVFRTKINGKINDPTDPAIVLLGLILDNFFPLKVLPKINPPISELIHIENK